MNIGIKKPSSKKSITNEETEKSKEKIEKDIISNSSEKNDQTNNSNIRHRVSELEESLGINTKPRNIPEYLIIAAWLCVLSRIRLIIVVGLILGVIALILSFGKSYKNAYKWNKTIKLYLNNDIEKAKIYLDKLSSSEKEGQAYKEMLKLLNKRI